MNEEELRQLFKNRANCYADTWSQDGLGAPMVEGAVIQAMDEDCFIETLNGALRLHGVVGRSEQLKALLEKLLNENMCSVAGDELIEEVLKGF